MIRRMVVAVSVALSAVLVSGCIMVQGTPPIPPQSGEATPTPQSVQTSAPVTHGVVGEKLSAGPWTVTIEESARTGKSVGGQKPGGGEDLLTITVGFENMGTDALQVRPQDFALTDAAGKPLKRAETSQPAFNANSMRPLMARYGTTTIFVYRVPKGRQRFTFAFKPPGLGTTLEWQVP